MYMYVELTCNVPSLLEELTLTESMWDKQRNPPPPPLSKLQSQAFLLKVSVSDMRSGQSD